jgi:hypothetical protein
LFTNFFNLIHVFMKKGLFFAALAALAMTGCSSDETIEQQTLEAQSPAIGFRTVANSGTRATMVDGVNITDFQVSAFYYDDADVAADPAVVLMDKVAAVRDLGANTYSYAPTKYFPVDGEAVDFYAFSPAGSRSVGAFTPVNTLTKGDAKTEMEIEYTVPLGGGAINQEDFLVASNLKAVGTTNPTSVALVFDHALSKVTFSAKNIAEGTTVNITGLSLVNLSNSATLTMSYPVAPVAANASAVLAWSGFGAADQTYAASVPTTGFSLVGAGNSSYSDLSTDNEGLMVLPQALAAWTGEDEAPGDTFDPDTDPYVAVTYGMNDASGTEIYPAGTVAKIPLSGALATTAGDLVAGVRTLENAYSYNLQFTFGATAGGGGGEGGGGEGGGGTPGGGDTPGGVNAISFTVSVDTWGNGNIVL